MPGPHPRKEIHKCILYVLVMLRQTLYNDRRSLGKNIKKLKVLVTRCVSSVKLLMGMHEKHLLRAVQPEGGKSFLERLSALGFSPSSVQILSLMSVCFSTKDIPQISAFYNCCTVRSLSIPAFAEQDRQAVAPLLPGVL